MHIEVVTLFPDMIRAALAPGVVGRALDRGLASVGTVDPREPLQGLHRTVDDRPYGGGPGMVLKPDVMARAITTACERAPAGAPRILLSAQGERFEQRQAQELAAGSGFVLVAGRYEGLDERVIETHIDREISLGDYILSGGELAALVVIDAVVRLLPGALGDERSSVEESFVEGLLDWPHYTRPVIWEGREVPAVLQNGNHADIRRWRLRQAVIRTWQRRPDLIGTDLSGKATLSPEAQRLLQEYLAQREGIENG